MNPRHGLLALRNQKMKIIDRIRNLDPALAANLADIQLDWYRIRNAAEAIEGAAPSDTTEVFIYDEIGGPCGVQADTFVQELNDISTPNIHVRLNSPGGSLFDSIAIYNALVKHPAHVTTYVDALAASGASIIAMAGDECVMMVGAQLMIHDALGVEVGNASDFRAMADFLDKQSQNIATVYSAKAGGSADSWRAMMQAETWMFAQEAVDMKLADSVYVRPDPPEPDDAATPPDDEPDGDEEDDTSNSMDEELEILMHARHRLTNRGYKYTGRKRSPGPNSTAKSIPGLSNSWADLVKW